MPQLCTFGASSARGFGLTEETGPGLPDDQFNLTTLLLPGNGTNGAQNNTFLDSSTNNLTITRNGNTTQGTFSPFSFGGGTAQANGYYSGYFDGTGDYLNQGTNRFLDGSTWTVEGWVYTSDTTATIAAQYVTSGGQFSSRTILGISSGLIYIFQAGSSVSGTTNISNNQWYHIAYVRNGSTVKAYVNGILEATFSGFINPSLTTTTFFYDGFNSGQEFFGYFSNLRVTTTEVYASNFTPPTSPLTAITGTSLLTCQSSQFIDNSANAFTITVNGNPQPTVVNPFGMTDWSGYFDGSGDYLSVADNAALDMGSSDFTMECWVYLNEAASASDGIFAKRADIATYGGVLFYINSTTPALRATTNGSTWGVDISSSITIRVGIWNHLAITRSGSTWTIWVNGVSGATATLSGTVPDNSSAFVIAAYDSGGNASYIFPSGLISNARVVKGTAVYTSTFTPPTAPLTAISGTSLLTCQSSTFVDNSTNAFTITVNGNSYTGTLNNPFGSIVNYTTPPLQYWSNYFDGTGDYLTVPELNIPASTSFTIEFWFYWSSAPSVFSMFISEDGGNSSKYIGYNVAGATLDMQMGGSASTVAYCSFTPTLNTWYHLAFVRNTNTAAIYVNGVSQSMSQATQSGAFLDVGTINYIGRWGGTTPYALNGYMSNFRAVVGAAVYNSNFTVPTTPLTAIQNTQLLTCQSNRFVDNSISARAITRYGDTSVQAFSPFNPDAAYSTTSVGGSGYFDGTGDSLTIPGSSAFDFGTGNFTAEAWVYPMGASSDMSMIDFWIGGGGSYVVGQWQLTLYTSDTLSFVWASGSNTAVRITSPSSTLPKNTWTHIAVTRTGNLFQIFTNGVLGASTTLTQAMGTTSSGRIGIQTVNNAAPFTGYISGARILKGTSLYTTGFVPPAAPFTAVTNTQLLLNYTNAGIPDATAKQVLETVGNAQISTAQSKFGGSSMSFDGTGDYLKSRLNDPIVFLGSGNWTIEGWVYLNTTSGTQTFITGQSDYATPANASYGLYVAGSSAGDFFYGSSFVSLGAPGLSATTWTHCAWVRNGSNINFYRNGTNITGVSIGANSINNGTTNPLCIGGANNSANPLNGYIDDLRITKGYARYTTNFTPPTQAFPLL